MAKYQLQIRQDATTVLNLDICAKYDGEGNDIAKSYEKKTPAPIADFVAAYDAGYNFNGKTVTFTNITYGNIWNDGSGNYANEYRIDFANGYKIHGSVGGGMDVLAYNPYAGYDETIYSTSGEGTTLPTTFEFHDGTGDIGADCTITGFYAITTNGATQITPSEFKEWITIDFDSLIEVDKVISVNGKKGKVFLKTSDLTNDTNYIRQIDLKTVNGESLVGGGDISIGIPVIDLGSTTSFATATGTLSDSDYSTIENSDVVALKLIETPVTHWFYLTEKNSSEYTFTEPNGGNISVGTSKAWSYSAPSNGLYLHDIDTGRGHIFFYSTRSAKYSLGTLRAYFTSAKPVSGYYRSAPSSGSYYSVMRAQTINSSIVLTYLDDRTSSTTTGLGTMSLSFSSDTVTQV